MKTGAAAAAAAAAMWAGIDIGGTKTAVVVSANPPAVLRRTEFPTLPTNGPRPVTEQIKTALCNMLREFPTDSESLARGLARRPRLLR